MQSAPKQSGASRFFEINASDVNIKFFFTVLRNFIASATLMAIGVMYISTEKLHLFDTIVNIEWINLVFGWSLIATGMFLCLANIYQSFLVFKELGLPKFLGVIFITYLSFASLIIIFGVERRILDALQIATK